MATTSEQALNTIAELGIQRIIQVDDANIERFSFEHVWEACSAFTGEEWAQLGLQIVGMPDLAWRAAAKAHWDSLNNDDQKRFAERALAACGTFGPAMLDADTEFQRAFKALFPGAVLQCWTLAKWRDCRNAVVNEARGMTTLVLFDLNFEREHATPRYGVHLLGDVKDETHLFFGILSHAPSVDNEPTFWNDVSIEAEVPKERFLVLSKRRLGQNDASLLLDGFRRMMLVQHISHLKRTCREILEPSIAQAMTAIDEISVYDFDQAIFRSSNVEGVWEGDTYFRLFNATVQRYAQRGMHESEELREQIMQIRGKFTNGKPVDPSEARTAWKLRRRELYEDPSFVNKHYLPITNGDIFRVTRGTGEVARTMVLVGQPCDLAVRSKGKRKFDESDFGRMAIWLEAEAPQAGDNGKAYAFDLDYFQEDKGERSRVHVGHVHYVRLAALDLCALNNDGRASLPLDTTVNLPLLLPSWQKRVTLLQEVWKEPLSRLPNDMGLNENQRNALMTGLIPRPCQSVNVSVSLEGDADNRVLTLGIERVGRMASELSTALLGAVAAYMSRPASAHDLARVK